MSWYNGALDSGGNLQVDFIWGNMPMQPGFNGHGAIRGEGHTFWDNLHTDLEGAQNEMSQYFQDAVQAAWQANPSGAFWQHGFPFDNDPRIGDHVIDYGWWNNYPGPQDYNGWD